MTTNAKRQPGQCLGDRFLPGSIPVGLYLRKVRAGIVSATPAAQVREKEVCCETPSGRATCFMSPNQGLYRESARNLPQGLLQGIDEIPSPLSEGSGITEAVEKEEVDCIMVMLWFRMIGERNAGGVVAQ